MNFKGNLARNILLLAILLLLVILFLSMVGQDGEEEQMTVKTQEVSLTEFKALYDARDTKTDGLIVLDLRSFSDWEDGNIPGSVTFTVSKLDSNNNVQKLNQYKEIVVVSDNVEAARSFVSTLKEKSWAESKVVYLLNTSIVDWFSAGYPRQAFVL